MQDKKIATVPGADNLGDPAIPFEDIVRREPDDIAPSGKKKKRSYAKQGDKPVKPVAKPKKPKPGEKNLGGRPTEPELDMNVLENLAAIQCTNDEIAAVFGMSRYALARRLKIPKYQKRFEQGKARGRASLRRLQWNHAQRNTGGGVHMAIHLAKHILGETDKSLLEVSARVNSTIEVKSVRDRIAGRLETLAQRIKGGVSKLAAGAGAELIPEESN